MGCRACAGVDVPHQDVAVRTQFASPDLIEAIVYRGLDLTEDPQWALSGAVDPDEYAYWAPRCCGMACLQMILLHRDGVAPALLPLLRGAHRRGAYVQRPDGSVLGMIYAPFVEYVRDEFGLLGEVRPELDVAGLVAQLRPGSDGVGRMLLASVHREIRRPERPAPGRGGHLVLVTGYDPLADTISFANPSGHTSTARSATLPTSVFAEFYAGRAVTVTLTGG